MNNYNNPYNQYPYTQYNNNYNQFNQQPQYQQPQQTTYLPLTFVNGIEGAKAFIVGANQTVYLKDSDSNILYEKRADQQGRYTLTAYEMNKIDMNNPAPVKYAQICDLNALNEKVNILSSKVEKLIITQNKGGNDNE